MLLVFYLDILIHKNVIDGGCYMKKLENDELLKVDGGTDVISATMINSIYKIVSFIYELGEALGSYIRRSNEDKMCNL